VCAVLGITADLLRWRFLAGKCPEVPRDKRGRLFSLEEIERLLEEFKSIASTDKTKEKNLCSTRKKSSIR
jgi:hypothetical protein